MVLRGGDESEEADDGVLRARVIDMDNEDFADKLHLHNEEGGEGVQWKDRTGRDGVGKEGGRAMAEELEVGPSTLTGRPPVYRGTSLIRPPPPPP